MREEIVAQRRVRSRQRSAGDGGRRDVEAEEWLTTRGWERLEKFQFASERKFFKKKLPKAIRDVRRAMRDAILAATTNEERLILARWLGPTIRGTKAALRDLDPPKPPAPDTNEGIVLRALQAAKGEAVNVFEVLTAAGRKARPSGVVARLNDRGFHIDPAATGSKKWEYTLLE